MRQQWASFGGVGRTVSIHFIIEMVCMSFQATARFQLTWLILLFYEATKVVFEDDILWGSRMVHCALTGNASELLPVWEVSSLSFPPLPFSQIQHPMSWEVSCILFFVCFCYYGNAGFVKRIWKCFFTFYLQKYLRVYIFLL